MGGYNLNKREFVLVVGALVVAMTLKFWLVLTDVVPFNADEAIVALMARHILQGSRPIFFYGQAYMGSLDAWLVAGGFAIFGQHVWVIRLVQGLLFCGTLIITVWLGREVFKSYRIGVVAVWLLAIPAVNVTLYTTASLGGYGEAMLLGSLIILSGMCITNRLDDGVTCPFWLWILFGFFVGLGFWTFWITFIYSGPIILFIVRKLYKQVFHSSGKVNIRQNNLIQILFLIFLGFLVGSAPWWRFAMEFGFNDLINGMSTNSISVIEGSTWLQQVARHLIFLLLFGTTVTFGLRPPWSVEWLGLPLLPFVLMFWVGVLAHIVKIFIKKHIRWNRRVVLASIILIVVLGVVFTPYGEDPSGRYFVLVAVPLALFAADMITVLIRDKGPWAWGLVALVLVYNLWGTVQSARNNPDGLTTQSYTITQIDHHYDEELSLFLREHSETRGYTNYWVSYPLAFLSQEELIFVPYLPYQDLRYLQRNNRYTPYNEIVSKAQQVAYITTYNPPLDQYLRQSFAEMGITWQEEQIGGYKVFYNFSEVARSEEIFYWLNGQ